MKSKIIIAAMAASLLAACSKEIVQDAGEGKIYDITEIRAQLEYCDGKTYLSSNGTSFNVFWQIRDTITLMSNGGSSAVFSLQSGSGSSEAVFKGSLSSTAAPFFAVYPSSLGAVKASGKVSFSLPQTQVGSITAANGVMPSIAYIPDPEDDIQFINLCGIFRIKLTGSVTVSKLELYDLGGAMLWGDASLDANSTLADPSTWVWTLANGDNKLIVDFSNNMKTLSSSATTFYFIVPPGALASGARVIIYDENGTAIDEFCSAKDLTVERSVIKPMKTVAVGTYTLLDLEGGSNCYLTDRSETSVTYKFCASRGDGSVVSGISSAEDLWETQNGVSSFNSGNVGYLIDNVSYGAGCVTFNVLNRSGNAFIAARDSDSNILWSWHIWMPYSAAVSSATLSGGTVMMDRNLGALYSMTGTSYSSSQVAFTYQWGRKDPFTMPYHTGNYSTLHYTAPANIITSELNMSADIDWALKNPTVFINITEGGYWDQNNAADWDGDSKSAYDPCPAGWRVPSSAQIGELSLGDWNSDTFSRTDSYSSLVFPATGRRYYSSTGVHTVEKPQTSVHYWTRTHGTKQAVELTFSNSTAPKTANSNKFIAHAVRCVKE